MPRARFVVGLTLILACSPDALQEPKPNRSPTAEFQGGGTATEGSPVSFDGRSSSDPDGDSLAYKWTFGDGTSATGNRPQHAYRDEGSYFTTLIVTDPSGASDTAIAEIIVSNAAPVVSSVSTPAGQRVNQRITITVAYADPGSEDTHTFLVEWGDGTSDTVTSPQPGHSYNAAGTYQIRVTVRDNDGAEASRVAELSVADASGNHPPVAELRGPSLAREGQHAMFSARNSRDPDGDSLRFIWLSGDGRTIDCHNCGPEVGWPYPDDGMYSVSLIVRDPGGLADTASTALTVQNAAPVISSIRPAPQQAAGTPGVTHIAFSDSGSADTQILTVHWGDGTRDSVEEASGAFGDSLTHTYAVPGSYVIRATIQDKDGASDSATATDALRVIDPRERQTVAGYEVFDLGTLGGNSARPADFNDHGKVVGSSLTASRQAHAFLWQDGEMRDLGTLGFEGSEAERINNAGVIAGTVWPAGRHEDCGRSRTAAIWQNGNGTLLDSRGATGMPVRATAINESADIAWSACGHENAYAWLSQGNDWKRLGAIIHPQSHSSVAAMNERGHVVGGSPAVSTGDSPNPVGHATVWEDGVVRDLGVLTFVPCRSYPDRNCGYSSGSGINETGQIVGVATAADRSMHAVLWTNGVIRDLWKAPPFPSTEGGYIDRVVINDEGQVAGSGSGEGFFWSDGTLHALGSLGGGSTSVVDMNEAGTVVGTSRTQSGEQHAFVWTQEGGMVDLGTGPHGLNAAWVVGISFFGDIAGFTAPCDPRHLPRCYPPQEVRAVLWRRLTPENATRR